MLGCRPGAVAEKLRPDDPTYAGAMGEDLQYGERPTLLVVDWEPENRVDLEVAMKKGVAVVALDAGGPRLLDCELPGEYAFLGTTRKERVVRLLNRDEVAANLPLNGTGLAAKLEAGFARGATLDVALVMIGKRTAAARRARRDQLQGECSDATHIVRGATVGAFAMATGTKAQVRTAAELFKLGANATSSSERSVQTTEGDLASCTEADPDAETPPPQCGAPLRLELAPVVDGEPGTAPPAGGSPPPTVDACPGGTMLREGKCIVQAGAPRLCDWRDPTDCQAQCDAGHPGSCLYLGFAYEKGIAVRIEPAKAFGAYERACQLNAEEGCRAVAYFRVSGFGVHKDVDAAVAYYQPACLAGDAGACSDLGALHAHGNGVPKDLSLATKLYRRACDGGNARGCVNLGQAYELGDHVKADPAKAADLYERACLAEHPAGCSGLAHLYDLGKGVDKDPQFAVDLLGRACGFSAMGACVELGLRHDTGKGTRADPERAVALFSRACEVNHVRGCANLGLMLLEGRGATKDEAKAAKLFHRACGESRLACDTLGELYARGIGVKKDRAKARQILADACRQGDRRSCKMKSALGL